MSYWSAIVVIAITELNVVVTTRQTNCMFPYSKSENTSVVTPIATKYQHFQRKAQICESTVAEIKTAIQHQQYMQTK